jgi:hypothetical protein
MGGPHAGALADPGASGNFGVGFRHEDRVPFIPNENMFYVRKVLPLPVEIQGGLSGEAENRFHTVLS